MRPVRIVLGVVSEGLVHVPPTGVTLPYNVALIMIGNRSGTANRNLFFCCRGSVIEIADGGGQVKADTSDRIQIQSSYDGIILKTTGSSILDVSYRALIP